jgi:GDPmannose 4,6-dehydratase
VKKALIFGVNGQDGSYLAELLLAKGYQVVGWIPAGIPISLENVNHILEKITLVKGDLLDQGSITGTIEEHLPDEVYNLAAPSFPASSWRDIIQVGNVVALGVARVLEAIRQVHPRARLFQASSSELFGDPVESPQGETTPFYPRNPYGMAKLYAHWAVVNYRQQYGLYAVSGIMFNHESPRRPVEFLSRKITAGAVGIKAGQVKELRIGNLEACRDWGYAPEYVDAMWRMLQCEQPGDYVIGTGESHSVREFLEQAFGYLDMDWREYVKTDQLLFRPAEPNRIQADNAKARRNLDWEPHVFLKDLVRIMVDADMGLRGLNPPGEGARILESLHL